jgi:hypothetical protein
MALARLLTKDFGLYAMVTTIMGFLDFQDIGSLCHSAAQKIGHAGVNLFCKRWCG